MCYNCGCMMPDNPMGKGHAGAESGGKSVTNKTFAEAARSMEQMDEQSKKNALDLLKKVLGEKQTVVVKDDSGYDRYDDAPGHSHEHGHHHHDHPHPHPH